MMKPIVADGNKYDAFCKWKRDNPDASDYHIQWRYLCCTRKDVLETRPGLKKAIEDYKSRYEV